MLEMAASKEEFFYEVERLKVKLASKEQENKVLESNVKGLESTVSVTCGATELTKSYRTHPNPPELTRTHPNPPNPPEPTERR